MADSVEKYFCVESGLIDYRNVCVRRMRDIRDHEEKIIGESEKIPGYGHMLRSSRREGVRDRFRRGSNDVISARVYDSM